MSTWPLVAMVGSIAMSPTEFQHTTRPLTVTAHARSRVSDAAIVFLPPTTSDVHVASEPGACTDGVGDGVGSGVCVGHGVDDCDGV